jgi:hypothetical protein
MFGTSAVSRVICLVALIGANSVVRAQTLDQQERCASSARKTFNEVQAEDNTEARKPNRTIRVFSSDYESHYNTKLNRCLVLVKKVLFVESKTGLTVYLVDANERREYAYYFDADGKILGCTLSASKPVTYCKTKEEFDEFVARYME